MNVKAEYKWLILIAIFSFLIYANSLSGDFVYDDKRQIVRNPLIQNASLYGKAITSDVWAFKGGGLIAASNYWRPTFVAWMIVNYSLFGLNPFGWHLLNVLLHMGVCLLAYLLLRRWNLTPAVAFAISLVFAVHPVHTESVAWISGSPDLLFSIFFLASLWFAESWVGSRRRRDLILSVLFYALALGAKEIGILCFPIFALVFSSRNSSPEIETEKKSKHKKKSKNESATPPTNALNAAAPFLITAIIYFFLRLFVLKAISLPVEDAASFGSAILSVPSIFVFYVRQIVFPYWIAAAYPLRTVQTVWAPEFLVPLINLIVIVGILWLVAKRSFVQKLGLALFILPLLPAMNASAFPPEHIVHDRYLYLPLLGFLMVIVPYLGELAEKFVAGKKELIVAAAGVALSLPLSFVTYNYNQVWLSDLALWQHSVVADSSSALNWSQYGAELSKRQKIPEAILAYENSLRIRPSEGALAGQARNLLILKKYDEAARNLKAVIAMPNEEVDAYTLYQSYDTLAIVLLEQKKYEEAESLLIDARKRLPIYQAALTEKFAAVLYIQNRKEDALRELEAAKTKARAEMLLESKNVFLRLGMLYFEFGRKNEARANLEEFLRLTANAKEETSLPERRQAEELLEKLQ